MYVACYYHHPSRSRFHLRPPPSRRAYADNYFSQICATYNSPVFPGTALVNCSFVTQDIEDCQARGKIVTLSLGGASANTDFKSEEHAREFAQLIWDLFLGGSHEFRPFGKAVLDGWVPRSERSTHVEANALAGLGWIWIWRVEA